MHWLGKKEMEVYPRREREEQGPLFAGETLFMRASVQPISRKRRTYQLLRLVTKSWENILFYFFQGAKTGKDNGYTMLLDIESFDYKFFNEGSEGLKVALVHHLVRRCRRLILNFHVQASFFLSIQDMPIMRQIGFHISPGTENQLAVTPTLISTSEVGAVMQRSNKLPFRAHRFPPDDDRVKWCDPAEHFWWGKAGPSCTHVS